MIVESLIVGGKLVSAIGRKMLYSEIGRNMMDTALSRSMLDSEIGKRVRDSELYTTPKGHLNLEINSVTIVKI